MNADRKNDSTFVYLASMAQSNDDHDQSVFFEGTDQAVVSDPVLPVLP